MNTIYFILGLNKDFNTFYEKFNNLEKALDFIEEQIKKSSVYDITLYELYSEELISLFNHTDNFSLKGQIIPENEFRMEKANTSVKYAEKKKLLRDAAYREFIETKEQLLKERNTIQEDGNEKFLNIMGVNIKVIKAFARDTNDLSHIQNILDNNFNTCVEVSFGNTTLYMAHSYKEFKVLSSLTKNSNIVIDNIKYVLSNVTDYLPPTDPIIERTFLTTCKDEKNNKLYYELIKSNTNTYSTNDIMTQYKELMRG